MFSCENKNESISKSIYFKSEKLNGSWILSNISMDFENKRSRKESIKTTSIGVSTYQRKIEIKGSQLFCANGCCSGTLKRTNYDKLIFNFEKFNKLESCIPFPDKYPIIISQRFKNKFRLSFYYSDNNNGNVKITLRYFKSYNDLKNINI